MCKILTQSHSCGHSITLKRELCFLVKNKFQCTNEEKRQLRSSRRDCEKCRKQERKIRLAGVIPSPVKGQSLPDSPKEVSQEPLAPKHTQPDPSSIVANLEALCAKLAAEQRAGVTPKPDSIRHNSTTLEIQVLKASTVSTTKPAHALRELPGLSENPHSVRRGKPVKADLFSVFLDEMDPHARGSSLTEDNHQSRSIRQPWTRGHSDRAASFGGTGRIVRPSQFPLLSSSRNDKDPGRPSLRPSTPGDTGRDSNLATRNACPANSRTRRDSSKLSDTSVRAAKKHINEMLNRDFEQTACLGEIVLQSPEATPLRQDPSGEYDPVKAI
jgi:hypothetical protein